MGGKVRGFNAGFELIVSYKHSSFVIIIAHIHTDLISFGALRPVCTIFNNLSGF